MKIKSITQVGQYLVDYNFYLHSSDDQPSVVQIDGSKHWHFMNHCHRINGPAIIYNDSVPDWYYYLGTFYKESEVWWIK